MKKNISLGLLLASIICTLCLLFTPLGKWINNAAISYLSGKNSIGTGIENNMDIPFTTPGVTIKINTEESISGNIIEPEDPREFLDYIINYGEAGKDFLMVIPPKPPIIHSSDKNENNKVMYTYFNKNIIIFDIPDNGKTPYIFIKTKKEVPDNRDIFLGLDGKSMGAIRKDKSLPIFDYNEYLYPLYGIIKAGYNGDTFMIKNYLTNGKLKLNFFVGEMGNYVEKIIIFFK